MELDNVTQLLMALFAKPPVVEQILAAMSKFPEFPSDASEDIVQRMTFLEGKRRFLSPKAPESVAKGLYLVRRPGYLCTIVKIDGYGRRQGILEVQAGSVGRYGYDDDERDWSDTYSDGDRDEFGPWLVRAVMLMTLRFIGTSDAMPTHVEAIRSDGIVVRIGTDRRLLAQLEGLGFRTDATGAYTLSQPEPSQRDMVIGQLRDWCVPFLKGGFPEGGPNLAGRFLRLDVLDGAWTIRERAK